MTVGTRGVVPSVCLLGDSAGLLDSPGSIAQWVVRGHVMMFAIQRTRQRGALQEGLAIAHHCVYIMNEDSLKCFQRRGDKPTKGNTMRPVILTPQDTTIGLMRTWVDTNRFMAGGLTEAPTKETRARIGVA